MAQTHITEEFQPPARLQPLRLKAERCTAYVLGGFGYRRIEAREIEVKVGPFAQYPAAVRVEWIQKGKRTRVGMHETSGPSLIVVAGYGHPDVSKAMIDTTHAGTTPGIRTSATRWTCWAPEWIEDFERTHGAFLASAPILADYRGHDVSGGARFVQLTRGAELTAGDRVATKRGPGVIVQVGRRGEAVEAYRVRMDHALRDVVASGTGEAWFWWIPATDCRWEGAPNASEVAS